MVHIHIKSKHKARHGWCREEEEEGSDTKPNLKCLASRNIDLFKMLWILRHYFPGLLRLNGLYSEESLNRGMFSLLERLVYYSFNISYDTVNIPKSLSSELCASTNQNKKDAALANYTIHILKLSTVGIHVTTNSINLWYQDHSLTHMLMLKLSLNH